MPQLDFSTYLGQFLWLLISFFILYSLVWFLFFPKIEEIINSRIDLIKNNLNAAEEAIKKAKEIKTAMEAKLKATNENAQIMSLEADREVKLILETKAVENDNITSTILKEKAAELTHLGNLEIAQGVPAIVEELKQILLSSLTLDQNSGRKNDYS
ncbi:MAG: hypothetical protein AB8V23_00570 [Candidatus Midichloria sp.]|uniref:F0F1-type ATP synthase subunit b n=1 Tax=Hyalomma marginatum TaxID=34627 RepID=A0A8S4C2T2_9ACAR|nr:F0F1-type ATP synthase subunit b [Hyalomma marginatum]CAG7599788.1 F0F1-type ATP synthase subunit b [Hyalomma marginatum]